MLIDKFFGCFFRLRRVFSPYAATSYWKGSPVILNELEDPARYLDRIVTDHQKVLRMLIRFLPSATDTNHNPQVYLEGLTPLEIKARIHASYFVRYRICIPYRKGCLDNEVCLISLRKNLCVAQWCHIPLKS